MARLREFVPAILAIAVNITGDTRPEHIDFDLTSHISINIAPFYVPKHVLPN